MKTLFTLLLLIVFQFSVAQEQNINMNLKEKYEQMIQSESYKNFEKAANIYSSKIKFRNDPVTMSYREPFLKAIADNIELTDFKDFEEAKIAFATLNQKYVLMKNDNQGFYQVLNISETWDLADIMSAKNKIEDPCECELAYGGALRRLALKYESILKHHEESAVSAWLVHEETKKSVLNALDLCYKGCKK